MEVFGAFVCLFQRVCAHPRAPTTPCLRPHFWRCCRHRRIILSVVQINIINFLFFCCLFDWRHAINWKIEPKVAEAAVYERALKVKTKWKRWITQEKVMEKFSTGWLWGFPLTGTRYAAASMFDLQRWWCMICVMNSSILSGLIYFWWLIYLLWYTFLRSVFRSLFLTFVRSFVCRERLLACYGQAQ